MSHSAVKQTANQAVVTDISEQVSEIISDESAENASDESAFTPREELPSYVQLMQMYYENNNYPVCDSKEPCYYDFTGLGKDFSEVWEDDTYKITMRAVTACDWIMFYFYDVEMKQGADEANAWNTHVGARFWDETHSDYCELSDCFGVIDATDSDSNVSHYYGIVRNMTGVSSLHDLKASQIEFVVHSGEDGVFPLAETTFDFVEKEFPLHEITVQPNYLSKFTEYGFLGIYGVSSWLDDIAEHPLTRCAETPFGIIYFSDYYEKSGEWAGYSPLSLGSIDSPYNYANPEEMPKIIDEGAVRGILSYTGYQQKNADGEIIKSLKFSYGSYCGRYSPYDDSTTGISCLYALFDQPVDLQAGELVLANNE